MIQPCDSPARPASSPSQAGGDEGGSPALGIRKWAAQAVCRGHSDPGVQVGTDRLPLTSDSLYQGHRLTWRVVICTYSKLFLVTEMRMCLSPGEHGISHVFS